MKTPTLEHEKRAAVLIENYFKSYFKNKEQHKEQNKGTTLTGWTLDAVAALELSLEGEGEMLASALDVYDMDDLIYFAADIAGVLDSKDKGLCWNLIARAVYEFFDRMRFRFPNGADLELIMQFLKEGE